MRYGPRPKLVGDPDQIDPLLARPPAAKAHQSRQEDCDICGLVERGCFGFGCSRTQRGVWACQDLECREEAERRARLPAHHLEAAE